MSKRAVLALALIVASSNVFASYYGNDFEEDDVREYIVRERHLDRWDDDEVVEFRHQHDRRFPAGWGVHRWGPPGHARRVFRENCPPPRRFYRGRIIERVESPYFDFRIRYPIR